MKKLLTAILSLSLLGAAALPALADDGKTPVAVSPESEITALEEDSASASAFTIEVDGEQVNAHPCVMVPVRAVAEKLGFTVSWDSGVVTVTGPERYARLTIGKDEYFTAPTQEGMMGASLFSLGCAPYVTNGATYAPVELFDALLGCRPGTVTLEGNAIKISTGPNAVGTVQIPNPFTDHATLAEAAQAVGFELSVPESVHGSPRGDIQTLNGEMIQVFYGDEDHEICIRKAPGDEDISGDYTVYVQTDSVTVNGASVLMKGENDLFHLAVWTGGGYTYSVHAQGGMSSADMTALARSVK